ncbi:MAG TPA: glycosyltransferase, partial [Spirochaetia bacterium]|nr:glycosyltransferase [Spirochaetia bacterium]
PRMPAVYQAADIFTIASVSETQGLVTVEAMASGLPVIAKNDPANREIVGHGKFGLLFDRNEELPGAVRRVLTEPTLKNRLSASSLEGARRYDGASYGRTVREYYSWVVKDYHQLKKKRKVS